MTSGIRRWCQIGCFQCVVVFLLGCLPVFAHAESFTAAPLSQVAQRDYIHRGLWHAACPLGLDRLRRLTLSYYDFEGQSHDNGELIVMDAAADHMLVLFKGLYRRKFPIAKIRPTSEYNGDDNASMADNNTSAFNCRMVTGESTPSLHAYGLAIDLNTVQNPFVQRHAKAANAAEVLPPQGIGYLNRANRRPGMAEEVVHLFAKHGFPVWGGTWNNPIDWQHFQPSRTVAQLLATMTTDHAREFFALYTRHATMLTKAAYPAEGALLVKLYQRSPQQFLQLFRVRAARVDALEPSQAIRYLDERMGRRD